MKKLFLMMVSLVHVGLFSMQRTRPLQSLNIKFLKETHTVLPDSDYAPFWGLTFIEKNIAEQWYRLSSKQIVKNIQASGFTPVAPEDKDSILKVLSEQRDEFLSKEKNTFTQNLVGQMFHVAGGTFNVTNALNNPVRQLTPQAIGGVLRIVHDGVGLADLKLGSY